MTNPVRTAREVLQADNLELWNMKKFELAEELIADTWAEMDSLRFDLNIVIDSCDGEHAAMVWDSTMTKDDNEVKVASIEVFRVVDGQIVEIWNCGYKLGV